MPTVEVYNGNLEDALSVFKRKSQAEGIMGVYKRSLAFIPAHEERTQRAYRRERKRRERASR